MKVQNFADFHEGFREQLQEETRGLLSELSAKKFLLKEAKKEHLKFVSQIRKNKAKAKQLLDVQNGMILSPNNAQERNSLDASLVLAEKELASKKAKLESLRNEFYSKKDELNKQSELSLKISSNGGNPGLESDILADELILNKVTQAFSSDETAIASSTLLVEKLGWNIEMLEEKAAMLESRAKIQSEENELKSSVLKNQRDEIGVKDKEIEKASKELHSKREILRRLSSELEKVKQAEKDKSNEQAILIIKQENLEIDRAQKEDSLYHLEFQMRRFALEKQAIEGKIITENQAKISGLAEKAALEIDLTNSLGSKEELLSANAARANKISLLEKRLQSLRLLKAKKDAELSEKNYDKCAFERSTRISAEEDFKTLAKISEKKLEIAMIKNEIAKILVSTVNVQATNNGLNNMLTYHNNALQEAEIAEKKLIKLIEKHRVTHDRTAAQLDDAVRDFEATQMKQEARYETGVYESQLYKLNGKYEENIAYIERAQEDWASINAELVVVQDQLKRQGKKLASSHHEQMLLHQQEMYHEENLTKLLNETTELQNKYEKMKQTKSLLEGIHTKMQAEVSHALQLCEKSNEEAVGKIEESRDEIKKMEDQIMIINCKARGTVRAIEVEDENEMQAVEKVVEALNNTAKGSYASKQTEQELQALRKELFRCRFDYVKKKKSHAELQQEFFRIIRRYRKKKELYEGKMRLPEKKEETCLCAQTNMKNCFLKSEIFKLQKIIKQNSLEANRKLMNISELERFVEAESCAVKELDDFTKRESQRLWQAKIMKCIAFSENHLLRKIFHFEHGKSNGLSPSPPRLQEKKARILIKEIVRIKESRLSELKRRFEELKKESSDLPPHLFEPIIEWINALFVRVDVARAVEEKFKKEVASSSEASTKEDEVGHSLNAKPKTPNENEEITGTSSSHPKSLIEDNKVEHQT